jgi:hypothetical protein
MSAVRDLLDDLAVIGATIEPAGDRLLLRAGPTAIPGGLVNRIREAKADLIATLAVCKDRFRVSEQQNLVGHSPHHRDNDRTCEAYIVDWLNKHPAPSAPGRCAWCGKPELPSAVVLPFGTEPGMHAWLHAECWSAWHQRRRGEAVEALGAIGITLGTEMGLTRGR